MRPFFIGFVTGCCVFVEVMLSTPSCLKTSIRLNAGKKNVPMAPVSAQNVYKMKGSGTDAYLIVVRESALGYGF